jgi:phosphatidylserine/phosphatidylglycerophosphate/cardiolipin synthase-like enzyme
VAETPTLLGREDAVRLCRAAGGDRFAVYDLENRAGAAVYVHAKVAVVDDVWATIGSDNLNRRSWTHDSELSVAVLDAAHDGREPVDPAGLGDGARCFARDLRLRLWREHLDRGSDDVDDLLDPASAFAAFAAAADGLQEWYDGGCSGPRPPGRVLRAQSRPLGRGERLWSTPVYRLLYDPDGRALRDRLRRRT